MSNNKAHKKINTNILAELYPATHEKTLIASRGLWAVVSGDVFAWSNLETVAVWGGGIGLAVGGIMAGLCWLVG